MIADKMVFVENRVFVSFHKNERGKHKSTSYTPYTRENTVSSTIITFLDKTNLRKQTSVHLFMRSNYANCRRKNVPQKLILINSPND